MSHLFMVRIMWKGHTLIHLPFIRRIHGNYLCYYDLFWIEETSGCLSSWDGYYDKELFWESMSLSYPQGGFSILSQVFEDPKGSFRLRQCINALVQILLNQVKYPNPLSADFCIDEYKLSLKDISLIKRLYNETMFRFLKRPGVKLSDKRNYYYKSYSEFFLNPHLKSLLSKELDLRVDMGSFEKVMSRRRFMFFICHIYSYFYFTIGYHKIPHELGLKLLNESELGYSVYYRLYGQFILAKFSDVFCVYKEVSLDRELDVRLNGQTFYYSSIGPTPKKPLYALEPYVPYLWLRDGKDVSVYNELRWGGYSSFFEGLDFRNLLRKLRKMKRVSSSKSRNK